MENGSIFPLQLVIFYFKTISCKKEKNQKRKKRTQQGLILFAVIAATILRTFLIEAYTIPTSSMEKSMLVGDFLL